MRARASFIRTTSALLFPDRASQNSYISRPDPICNTNFRNINDTIDQEAVEFVHNLKEKVQPVIDAFFADDGSGSGDAMTTAIDTVTSF